MTSALSPDAPTSLNAGRRIIDLEHVTGRLPVDLLVVGGGVVGVGVALDAATRGLRVALLERHDLAFGTSRWSSKLVHGGLRYLASGDLRLAHESAVERGILMCRTAPHLIRPLPLAVPFTPDVSRTEAALVCAGVLGGDLLRVAAGTPRGVLPRPRRLSHTQMHELLPAIRPAGLRGGVLAWDGQLIDDARLVVALARTAAGHGARVITRAEVTALTGEGAEVVDTTSGTPFTVRARAVVNATGVWAGQLAEGISLRPSRGTHLVVPAAALGRPGAGITVPVAGQRNRFVFVLPQRGGHVYIGLTDEPLDGIPPDVPQPERREVRFLLDSINRVLAVPLREADVIGTFAGVRPLLPGTSTATADLSRRHAVIRGADGVVTVVGGKLTTYRRMAEEAVDLALAGARVDAAPCQTRTLAAVGAAPRYALDRQTEPRRLIDRYGAEAGRVLAEARGDPDLLRPLADGVDVTGAEVLFAVRHEGALDAGDVLDRRTRIGVVPAERQAALPAVDAILQGIGVPTAGAPIHHGHVNDDPRPTAGPPRSNRWPQQVQPPRA